MKAPWPVNMPGVPSVRSDNVSLAAIKRAEGGDALNLRLREFRGKGGTADVTMPVPVKSVTRVNLLER